MVQRVEKLGVSTSVTYYALALGAPDATTGQYARGYTPSTVNMVIFPHAPIVFSLPSGVHAQNVATGFTDTQIFEGDRIEDSTGLDYVVTTVKDVAVGDRTVYYECELSMLFPGDISDTVYPWPAPPTEGGVSLNVGAALFKPLTTETILDDLIAYDNIEKTCSTATVLDVDGPRNNQTFTCSTGTVLDVDGPRNNQTFTCSTGTVLDVTVV